MVSEGGYPPVLALWRLGASAGLDRTNTDLGIIAKKASSPGRLDGASYWWPRWYIRSYANTYPAD